MSVCPICGKQKECDLKTAIASGAKVVIVMYEPNRISVPPESKDRVKSVCY